MKQTLNSFMQLVYVSAACFFCLCTSACIKESSDIFDVDKTKKAAEMIVRLASENRFDEIKKLGTKELNEALTTNVINQLTETYLAHAGNLENIEKILFKEIPDKKSREKNALIIMKVKHKNCRLVWTCIFNQEMLLSGFFVK